MRKIIFIILGILLGVNFAIADVVISNNTSKAICTNCNESVTTTSKKRVVYKKKSTSSNKSPGQTLIKSTQNH